MSSFIQEAPGVESRAWKHRTDWLAARWGIMCHYLDSPASSESPSETSADAWNRRVDRFDVRAFVDQVEAVGAGYVILTVGQNSGHYCAPNQTLTDIVGRRPSYCSERNLIAEVADALTPIGVRLIAYLPSGAPECDARAVDAFEWQKGPYRLAAFQRKWEAVIREWGERWGSAVAGWWIDGCYYAAEMYEHSEAPNFETLSAALRFGNAERIIAFNGGVQTPIAPLSAFDDYTAGELNLDFPTANKWSRPERFIDGAQYHALSFLGDWWGEGTPRFSPEFVAGYTADVNARQGAVTWDVPIGPDGRIPTAFLQQLKRLG